VNQLLQECKDNGSSPADYLSTLVVDEVHMVGEPDR
jgi:replicative superfamily II helicase